MTPALIAFLPRAGSLSEDARLRFRHTSVALGLAPHIFDSGAAVGLGRCAVRGSVSAIAGDVYAAAGSPRPDLEVLCEDVSEAGPVPRDRGYWGDYLTFGRHAGAAGHRIDRSPFGNLPCFWMEEDTYVVAASSLGLLEAYAPVRPSVDWRQVALFLLSPQLRNGATCLEGVHELLAGSTLVVGRGQTKVLAHWSPWDFACSAKPLGSLGEASSAVCNAVDHAVAARCGELSNPVLLLSGGLDSSTIAAALAHGACGFSALTMVTRHNSGDERTFARAVAQATGAPLAECMRSPAGIDWDEPTPRRLVRPSARIFRQPTLRAAHRLASESGANVILDGGGGDDLFCSLNSVAPLLDRLAIEGPGRGSWQTARDLALRADVDILTVMRKTAQRRLSGRIAYGWPTVTDFLAPGALALASDAGQHPWLRPPPRALPGQAAHVALMLDALALSEDDSLDPAMRTMSPLVAQPVVEAALRVRSWLWFENGRNRAVVRHAIARRLPRSVVGRTGKGTPGGFVSELVEAHRLQLRELLLGGMLVARGIADSAAIEGALAEGAMVRGDRYGHLLVLADAERWARLRS